MSGKQWALVLAAGEGRRLSSLTVDCAGISVPKQFCSLDGGPSLLGLALDRAARVVPRSRITSIVATQHQRWWGDELAGFPAENTVEQPENRGTAIGVLLPLLSLMERDPEARIVFLPSDHFVGDEAVMARVIRRALEAVDRRPDRLVLLGITPDEPDSEFGWIVPSAPDEDGAFRVGRFVEKPPAAEATELMRSGGLWNSFVFAASAPGLLALYEEHLPDVLAELREAIRSGTLSQAYQGFETYDFCRDLLQVDTARLSVLPVPACGWSDLGTPERVADCLERLRARVPTEVLGVPLPAASAGPVLSASFVSLRTS